LQPRDSPGVPPCARYEVRNRAGCGGCQEPSPQAEEDARLVSRTRGCPKYASVPNRRRIAFAVRAASWLCLPDGVVWLTPALALKMPSGTTPVESYTQRRRRPSLRSLAVAPPEPRRRAASRRAGNLSRRMRGCVASRHGGSNGAATGWATRRRSQDQERDHESCSVANEALFVANEAWPILVRPGNVPNDGLLRQHQLRTMSATDRHRTVMGKAFRAQRCPENRDALPGPAGPGPSPRTPATTEDLWQRARVPRLPPSPTRSR
jgi:hypothetical protein